MPGAECGADRGSFLTDDFLERRDKVRFFFAPALCNWHLASAAESFGRYANGGSALAPLELISVNHADHARHRLGIVTGIHDLGELPGLLDVELQDSVEDFVSWE